MAAVGLGFSDRAGQHIGLALGYCTFAIAAGLAGDVLAIRPLFLCPLALLVFRSFRDLVVQSEFVGVLFTVLAVTVLISMLPDGSGLVKSVTFQSLCMLLLESAFVTAVRLSRRWREGRVIRVRVIVHVAIGLVVVGTAVSSLTFRQGFVTLEKGRPRSAISLVDSRGRLTSGGSSLPFSMELVDVAADGRPDSVRISIRSATDARTVFPGTGHVTEGGWSIYPVSVDPSGRSVLVRCARDPGFAIVMAAAALLALLVIMEALMSTVAVRNPDCARKNEND